ncbi:hypothetical protein MKW92_019971 [Papaver armeniacum]|nr:hypothetical protein MKW92_019971 [Papaver armeniacum]
MELSDLAIIKVLNSIWHIKLKKAEGVLLFENGWPEFMEFYSICVGHVIFFRYDGDSEFQVHIFGMDGTEIDYPSHIDNTNHEVEMTSTHSDEVEVVSIHSGSTQSNYEPSMSRECSLIQSNYEPSMSSESSLNSGSTQSNHEPSMSSESSYGKSLFNKLSSSRQEFSQKTQKQRTFVHTRIHTKAFQETLKAAEAFKSENPSFKRILQASHIKRILKVPNAFVTSYLKNITRTVITLRISDGRTWEVGYISETQTESKLSKGWYKFVADNHLKEGDVCVFELVDRKKFEMNVHFFRQQKTFDRKLNPKIRYYTTEFQATLEAAEDFTSENPFFKVVMQASYIEGQLMRVPAVFATSHLRNITETTITLMVSDGRTWKVRYVSRSPTDKRLSHGWCKFVADNDLKEGNVCVFELIDRKKIEMIVHIFRQHKPFSRKLPPKSSNYTAEFQATLEEAEKFTSENPFFKVVIQDAHIKAGTVRVPAVFATQHLTDITRMVITLRVSDERTWDVGYVSQTTIESRISQGWREFVAENDLKEGDVCVFELVDNRENFEMNVHIFRLVQGGID